MKIQEPTNRTFINHANVDSNRRDWHRRIALVLRKEGTGAGSRIAERLRSKWAMARSAAVVSDNEWEWYIILTLWSPQQVIRLLEDSGEQAVRRRQNSPFVSLLPVLWLIASSNRPRYSGIGDIGRGNGVWEQPCDPMLIFWLTHMSDSSYIVPWKFHQLPTPTQCPTWMTGRNLTYESFARTSRRYDPDDTRTRRRRRANVPPSATFRSD